MATRRGKQFNTLIYDETDPLTGAERDAVAARHEQSVEDDPTRVVLDPDHVGRIVAQAVVIAGVGARRPAYGCARW